MGLFDSQYTIGNLMSIDQTRQQKAIGCQVELEKTFHELKPQGLWEKFRAFFLGKSVINVYYVIFKLSVVSDTGHKYKVYIKTTPDFNLSNWQNNTVQIYCECNDFKYRSAYILNKHDALFLNDKTKVELGPAITTVPKKQSPSVLCKHAFAALQWLVNNYSNVMKTI